MATEKPLSRIDAMNADLQQIKEELEALCLDGIDEQSRVYDEMVWRRMELHRHRAELWNALYELKKRARRI